MVRKKYSKIKDLWYIEDRDAFSSFAENSDHILEAITQDVLKKEEKINNLTTGCAILTFLIIFVSVMALVYDIYIRISIEKAFDPNPAIFLLLLVVGFLVLGGLMKFFGAIAELPEVEAIKEKWKGRQSVIDDLRRLLKE